MHITVKVGYHIMVKFWKKLLKANGLKKQTSIDIQTWLKREVKLKLQKIEKNTTYSLKES